MIVVIKKRNVPSAIRPYLSILMKMKTMMPMIRVSEIIR